MTEEKGSKKLEKEVAEAMVSAVLAASPRLDTFSTWLMGITAGFLVILFTNLERSVSFIGIAPAKAIVVFLTISTVVGLFQKSWALNLHIQSDIQEARDRKMVELVRVQSGQSAGDPYQYFRENADVPYMLALFVSAFPKWAQKHIYKMILSVPQPDLSDLQKNTKRLFRQYFAIMIQLICALVTVVIVLFSL
jgi:hypothetical protein